MAMGRVKKELQTLNIAQSKLLKILSILIKLNIKMTLKITNLILTFQRQSVHLFQRPQMIG